jgi:tRNA pseudouridine32 synthase/23S rRNA pseudouridine746 synthase
MNPNPLELQLLHNDPAFLIVNKPGGVLAVPGRGPDKQDCVVNRAKKMFPNIIQQPAVHRLDMYTSGIMLLAKNSASHRNLSKQFEQRIVHKEYIAVLDGVVKEDAGVIDLRFRLDTENRPHQIFDPEQGKQGISHWQKICDKKGQSYIRFFPLTGRTHQLRLHASHPLGLGIPIVGDSLYGNGNDGDKMFLHACKISFLHPISNERIQFVSKADF